MKELDQVVIFERLQKREIGQEVAARALNVTTRWIRTKLKRFIEQGAKGLVHQSRGKQSSRRWDEKEEAFSLELLRGDFAGFGPTFAAQKLEQLHKIIVSKETLRKAMMAKGLWHGKKRKIKHRAWRERKPYFGEMVQSDGSPHDWFEGRAPWCTLISFVDDATSRIGFMMLAANESYESLMGALRQYVDRFGIPKSIYVDYGCVFSVNTNNKDRGKKTQFERVCQELGITVIHASSPQAKGRVERSHSTHQDRLVKELRLAGISDIEQANKFILETYLPQYNRDFSVPAAKNGDVHSLAANYKLDNIFCLKDTRQLQNDFTILYKTRILQLTSHQKACPRPKNEIMVHEKFDGTLELYLRKIRLNHIELQRRPPKASAERVLNQRLAHKPASDHPWRRWIL